MAEGSAVGRRAMRAVMQKNGRTAVVWEEACLSAWADGGDSPADRG
jgi:hypothetical protein